MIQSPVPVPSSSPLNSILLIFFSLGLLFRWYDMDSFEISICYVILFEVPTRRPFHSLPFNSNSISPSLIWWFDLKTSIEVRAPLLMTIMIWAEILRGFFSFSFFGLKNLVGSKFFFSSFETNIMSQQNCAARGEKVGVLVGCWERFYQCGVINRGIWTFAGHLHPFRIHCLKRKIENGFLLALI